jgi:hypothetical protein
MSRLFSSGFEANNDTSIEWSARSGVQTFTTTNQRSGAYALQLSSLGSGVAKGLRYDFQASANNGPFFFRVYTKPVSALGAESRIILLNDTGNLTAPIVYLTLDGSRVLKLYDEDGQITGTATLTDGVYSRIEFEISLAGGAGAHIVKARVDGVEFAAATNRSLSAGVMALAVGANLGGEASGSGELYFDDIAINDGNGSFQNSYPGEGEIIYLRPSAAGDNNAWTRGGTDSGANWSQVDEVTPNDVTDYVESNTSGQIDDYNLEATPAAMDSDDVINCVQVGVRFALSGSTGSDPNFVVRVKASASGTVEESGNFNPGSTTYLTNAIASPNNYPLTLYDLPGASTTAWTKADLDTAQIGVRESTTDTDFVRVSAIWLLVDHKPGVAVKAPPVFQRKQQVWTRRY